MRRTKLTWMKRAIASCALTCATLMMTLVVVGPALGATATFDNIGFGFNEGPELDALPTFGIVQNTVPFLTAAEVAGGTDPDVGLIGSADLCIFIAADTACRATTAGLQQDELFSVLVTLQIVADPSLGQFTLILNTLGNSPAYGLDEINVELNPTAPPGLDLSGRLNLAFDHPVVHVEFFAPGDSVASFDVIGWTVSNGDFITLQYNSLVGPIMDPSTTDTTPQLLFNAVPVVVPEPGTALMMALGLAGLSWRGHRRR